MTKTTTYTALVQDYSGEGTTWASAIEAPEGADADALMLAAVRACAADWDAWVGEDPGGTDYQDVAHALGLVCVCVIKGDVEFLAWGVQ